MKKNNKENTLAQTLKYSALAAALSTVLVACGPKEAPTHTHEAVEQSAAQNPQIKPEAVERLDIYQSVELTSDLSHLTDNERKIVGLLIEASEIMDDLFWEQSFHGDKERFLNSLSDPKVRHFADMNYGPWDRLNNEFTFLTGFEDKPLGAGFYPADMTKAEFEAFDDPAKDSLYTVIRRDEQGKLYTIPYHEFYGEKLGQAADLLRQAADLSDNESFKTFLNLRADAFETDDYTPSEYAWMDLKDSNIDAIIGPIEVYEDRLYGYKAGFESYVLVKDIEWSERLAVYAKTLPALQKGLPVPAEYKAEQPGSDGQLNAYDVVYYAGHSNAGSKTIAVNLPNDEAVQLAKGTRRSQLKNAMQAKFDGIMVPIAELLVVPEQRQHITFNAFFANTMFHEVAHGLGIKNTLNGQGTVRAALKEFASPIEEGKADILGLYMVTQLLEEGILTEGQLEDYYVTFLAGIFRSVRFGASSAHGMANMIRFNYFEQAGAFSRHDNGLYSVNMAEMRAAVDGLSEVILRLQGDGDYQGVAQLFEEKGHIGEQLQADLDRIDAANIPVDVYFEQGKKQLGLE